MNLMKRFKLRYKLFKVRKVAKKGETKPSNTKIFEYHVKKRRWIPTKLTEQEAYKNSIKLFNQEIFQNFYPGRPDKDHPIIKLNTYYDPTGKKRPYLKREGFKKKEATGFKFVKMDYKEDPQEDKDFGLPTLLWFKDTTILKRNLR